jgi:hypothetical protein
MPLVWTNGSTAIKGFDDKVAALPEAATAARRSAAIVKHEGLNKPATGFPHLCAGADFSPQKSAPGFQVSS